MAFVAMVTILAAALLLLLPVTFNTGPASGSPQPVASSVPTSAPVATVVVTTAAQPKTSCEEISDVWSSTRLHHNDLLVPGAQFGTPVPGGNLADVLTSLGEYGCTDPTLLYDLESYVRDGFGAGHDSPSRQAAIDQYWHLTTAERSAKVDQLVATVKAGNPKIEDVQGSYSSWYYRDSTDPRIPILGTSQAPSTQNTFLVFEVNGKTYSLRLNCGFQPSQV